MRALLLALVVSHLGLASSQNCYSECLPILSHLGPDDEPTCPVVLDFIECIEDFECSGGIFDDLTTKANDFNTRLNCKTSSSNDKAFASCEECSEAYANALKGSSDNMMAMDKENSACSAFSQYKNCVDRLNCVVAQTSQRVMDATSELCLKNDTDTEDCMMCVSSYHSDVAAIDFSKESQVNVSMCNTTNELVNCLETRKSCESRISQASIDAISEAHCPELKSNNSCQACVNMTVTCANLNESLKCFEDTCLVLIPRKWIDHINASLEQLQCNMNESSVNVTSSAENCSLCVAEFTNKLNNATMGNQSDCADVDVLKACVENPDGCNNQLQSSLRDSVVSILMQSDCKMNLTDKFKEKNFTNSDGLEACTGCVHKYTSKLFGVDPNNPQQKSYICDTRKEFMDCLNSNDQCKNIIASSVIQEAERDVQQIQCDSTNSSMNVDDGKSCLQCASTLQNAMLQLNSQSLASVCSMAREFYACLNKTPNCKESVPSMVFENLNQTLKRINCDLENSENGSEPFDPQICLQCVQDFSREMSAMSQRGTSDLSGHCSIVTKFLNCLDKTGNCKDAIPASVRETADNLLRTAGCNSNTASETEVSRQNENCQACVLSYRNKVTRSRLGSPEACKVAREFLVCVNGLSCEQSIARIIDVVKQGAQRANCKLDNPEVRQEPNKATVNNVDPRQACETCYRDYSYKVSHSNRRLEAAEMCRATEEFLTCTGRSNCERLLPASIMDNIRNTRNRMNCDVDPSKVDPEMEKEVTTISTINRRDGCETCYRDYSYKVSHSNRRLEPAEMCKAAREFMACSDNLRCEMVLPASIIDNIRRTSSQTNCDVPVTPEPQPEPKPTTVEKLREVPCAVCMKNFQTRIDRINYSDNRIARMQICSAGEEFFNCVKGTSDCSQYGEMKIVEHAQKNLERLRCERIDKPKDPKFESCEECARQYSRIIGSVADDCKRNQAFYGCIQQNRCVASQQSDTFKRVQNEAELLQDCGWIPDPQPTPDVRSQECEICAQVFLSKFRGSGNPCSVIQEFNLCIEGQDKCQGLLLSATYDRAFRDSRSIADCGWVPGPRPTPTRKSEGCETCAQVFLNKFRGSGNPCSVIQEFHLCIEGYDKCEGLPLSATYDRAFRDSRSIADCGWVPAPRPTPIRKSEGCEKCAQVFLSKFRINDDACEVIQEFNLCIEQFEKCQGFPLSTLYDRAFRDSRSIADCGWVPEPPPSPPSKLEACENCASVFLSKFSGSPNPCGDIQEFNICIDAHDSCLGIELSQTYQRAIKESKTIADCGWVPGPGPQPTPPVKSRSESCEACAQEFSSKFRSNGDPCEVIQEFNLCIEGHDKCQGLQLSDTYERAFRDSRSIADCGWVPEPQPTPPGKSEGCERCAQVFQNDFKGDVDPCKVIQEFNLCIEGYDKCQGLQLSDTYERAFRDSRSIADCGWVPEPQPTPPGKSEGCERCAQVFQNDFRGDADPCKVIQDFNVCIEGYDKCQGLQLSDTYQKAFRDSRSIVDCGWVPEPGPQPKKFQACESCAKTLLARYRANQGICAAVDEFKVCISPYSKECADATQQSADFQRASLLADSIQDCGWVPVPGPPTTTPPPTPSICMQCSNDFYKASREISSSRDRGQVQTLMCESSTKYLACMNQNRCSSDGQATSFIDYANQVVNRFKCGSVTVEPPQRQSQCLQCALDHQNQMQGIDMSDRSGSRNQVCSLAETFFRCAGKYNDCVDPQINRIIEETERNMQSFSCRSDGNSTTVEPPRRQSQCLQCAIDHQNQMKNINMSDRSGSRNQVCSLAENFFRCVGRYNDCVDPQINRIIEETERNMQYFSCRSDRNSTTAEPSRRQSQCLQCAIDLQNQMKSINMSDRSGSRNQVCSLAENFFRCSGRYNDCVDPQINRIIEETERNMQYFSCRSERNSTTTEPSRRQSQCLQCAIDLQNQMKSINMSDRSGSRNQVCSLAENFFRCSGRYNDCVDPQINRIIEETERNMQYFSCRSERNSTTEPSRRQSQCLQCAIDHKNQMKSINMSDRSGSRNQVCSLAENFFRCVGRYNDCVDPQINRIVEETERNMQYFSCRSERNSTTAEPSRRQSQCLQCAIDLQNQMKSIDMSDRSGSRNQVCSLAGNFFRCVGRYNDCVDPQINRIIEETERNMRYFSCRRSQDGRNSTAVEPPRRQSQCLQCALDHQNQMRGVDTSDKSGSRNQVCSLAETLMQCVGRYNDCVDPQISQIVEQATRNMQHFSCRGGGHGRTEVGDGGDTDKMACATCIQEYRQKYRQIDFSIRSTAQSSTCQVVNTFLNCIKGIEDCEKVDSFKPVLNQADMTARHFRC